MTRKPTRRTISVRGLSYQRLQAYCERRGCSVSGWLEWAIDAHMSQDDGEPEHHVLKPMPSTPRKPAREWQEGDGDPLSGSNTW